MASRHLELVNRSFDAFARGDKAEWSAVADPEIEVVPVGDWPETELKGRDAVWDFLVAVDEPWEPGRFELSEAIEGDGRVLARMRRHLRGRSSGVEVDYDYWVGFTFEGARATRVQWFDTREQGAEALGLSG